MQPVLLKVYGNIYPVYSTFYQHMREICEQAISSVQDGSIIELDNDLLRISFEGIYFPKEDVLAVINENLAADLQGKLDYLDLESWTLERYIFKNKKIDYRKTSLNDVLNYSGH